LLKVPEIAGDDGAADFASGSFLADLDSAAAFDTTLATPTLPTVTGAADATATALGGGLDVDATAEGVALAIALATGGAAEGATKGLADTSDECIAKSPEPDFSAKTTPTVAMAATPATTPMMSPFFLRGRT
jgi:hypothetical protein